MCCTWGDAGAPRWVQAVPELQIQADAGLTSSDMLGDGRWPSSPLAGEPGLNSPLAWLSTALLPKPAAGAAWYLPTRLCQVRSPGLGQISGVESDLQA